MEKNKQLRRKDEEDNVVNNAATYPACTNKKPMNVMQLRIQKWKKKNEE